jgi:group I intron endonuclease
MKDVLCGIYKITNIVNGKVIIGQSRNVNSRWGSYLSLLRRNKYPNQHLQAAWNKYGEQNFKFDIIILCSVENLNSEEVRLIREYKSSNINFGYNLEIGGNSRGHSEETRRC